MKVVTNIVGATIAICLAALMVAGVARLIVWMFS